MKLIVCIFLLLVSFALHGNGYARFEENGKIGLKDNTGKIILPASFDELGWSDGNFSVINQITGYRQKNQWGLLNLNKEFITKAEFETITSQGGDRVIVSKFINPYTIKFGCIDLSGKLVIPFFYDEISLNGLRAIVMVKNGTRYEYGLVDLNDRSILPVHYSSVRPIGSLRYVVEDFSNKKALCSEEGKWITDFTIDEISDFQFDLAVIHKEWRQGVIDRNGEIKVEPIYREIKINGPNQLSVRKADEWKLMNLGHHDIQRLEADELIFKGNGLSQVTRNGKSGLVDDNFQLKWPMCFDFIGPFENKNAVVRENGLYGILRMNQSIMIPPVFDSLCREGNFIRTRSKVSNYSSWELYDTFGIRKTRSPYEFIGAFDTKFFPVKNRGYWGAVNRYGEEQIACVYDSLLEIREQLVVVKFKGHYGIITDVDHWKLLPQKNRVKLLTEDLFLEWKDSLCFLKNFNGDAIYFTDNPIAVFSDHLKETLPDGTEKEINFLGQIVSRKEPVVIRAERILPESEGLIGIKRDGKFGFVDNRGRLRIANRYDDIGPFHLGLAPVKLLNKWGFINTSDQIVIQPTYETIENFNHGVARVSRNGKYGLIDAMGNVLLELRYDSIDRMPDQLFLLAQDTRKGLADSNGRILIEPRFDELTVLPNHYVIVRQNNRFGLLTKDGLSVFPLQYNSLSYQKERDVFLVQIKPEWETLELK